LQGENITSVWGKGRGRRRVRRHKIVKSSCA
jgi:hypothetical protein